jgi:hypothetical protein
MATPDPANVAPWYLRNINQALALDEATGNVYVRTGFEGNIIISGNVNIPGNVDAHISEIGTSGNLTVPYMPIAGNITIDPGQTVEVTQGTDPWTVDGTVTANQGTSPWVVSGNVNATLQGTSTVAFSAPSTDAFGRLRVSEPFTLFDTQQRYYDHGQFSSSTSGTATVTYQANSSTFSLAIGSTSGDSIIRETKRVFPYQPGKSLLNMMSFCMATPKTNLRQRVGFFGAQNGIYFEADGTTLNMVIRSYSTGSLVEDRIPQSNWNGDRLNGAGGATNPSGITLNPAYDQIFWTDVEWLGVGSVRVGFIINGTYYICHTFHHANLSGNTTTYMTTATLPLRYEITNTGPTVSSSTMNQICCTVISEGGYNNFGSTQTAGTGTTQKRLSSANTYYPVVSIRLNSSRLDSIVLPRQIDVLSPTVNYYRWVLLQNATLTGATWATTSPTGTVDIDLAATAISGGTEIQSGYASSRELTQLSSVDYFQYQLGRTLAGVSDVVTLALAATANNADVLAELGWQELT